MAAATKRCRTKAGLLKLLYEDVEYVLDCAGTDLPVDLAESIRTHVNVVIDDPVVDAGLADAGLTREPLPQTEPVAEAPEEESGKEAEAEAEAQKPSKRRRRGSDSG